MLWIRKQDNTETDGKYTFKHKAIGATVALSLISLLIDRFIPFNIFLNAFRGIIAIALGTSLFIYLYIEMYNVLQQRIAKDQYYQPIRRRFSYNQRKNITAIGIALTILIIVLMPNDGALYTIFSGLSITIILLLLTFMRTYNQEHSRTEQGMYDLRDLNPAIEDEPEEDDE